MATLDKDDDEVIEKVRSPIEFIEYILEIGTLRHIRDMGAIEHEAREIVRRAKQPYSTY